MGKLIATEKLSQVSGKLTPRARKFIAAATLLVLALTALIIGLAVGLKDNATSPAGGQQIQDATKFKKSLEEDSSTTPRNKGSGYTSKRAAPRESQRHYYQSAAVTTDTNICSQYGADILRSGNGSVVDAAITTMLCAGLVNMQSCGIGGGFVATIYEKPRGQPEKVLVSLIARERAPLAATRDMYVNDSSSSTKGGKAVAVPGEIKGYYEAWNRFGKMPWKDLFQPAIKLCEEGFIVERELSIQIKNFELMIRTDPNFRELFVKENGSLIQEGDLLINKKLGATLRRIADDPTSFFNGSLADDVIADLNDYGGIITREDLQSYNASFKDPVHATIQNGQYVFYNPPPPTSGVVLDFIVNILDGFNFTSANISDDASKILTYHRIVEAYKFAYAKRSNLGDEDFVDVTELVANLTSDKYAEEIRRQIDDSVTHDIDYYGPTFDIKPDSGTSHMNILGPDGAAMALTSTINLIFGADVRGNRTGIIFNDEMDDFSTPGTYNSFGVPASPSNYIEPGKIPMSSMCPTLIFDETGSVVFMSGASGGTRITTATAFVTMGTLWFDIDLKNSTDLGRVHHQLAPNEIVNEQWIRPEIVVGLKEKNHTMVTSTSKAVVGSIYKQCLGFQSNTRVGECTIEAVSDGRKGGKPAGF